MSAPQPAARPGQTVALVISSLAAGGAERVLTSLANHWAGQRPVTVITFASPADDPFFPLHPDVRLVQLGLLRPSGGVTQALAANLTRVSAIRHALRAAAPAAIVAFTGRVNVQTIAAARGLGTPVIIAERTNPQLVPETRLWAALRRWTYPLADRVVFQSERVSACFPERVRRRGVVIANPVVLPPGFVSRSERPAGARFTLMGMGRLDADKAYDRLVRAFAALAAAHPLWDLEIWGDGPERARLAALAAEAGLAARVRLPGRTAEPLAQLATADLFALTSRFEGFPNVLLEALACGIPSVSLDIPFGPREIIRDGVDGLLVPPDDEPALVAALSRLMGDEAARARLAARAIEARERFHPELIMAQWDALLASLAQSPESARRGPTAVPITSMHEGKGSNMTDFTVTPATGDDKRFGFGANWRSFLAVLDDERIAVAEQSVRDLLGVDSLAGKTFLDVGCGSGLFSLAAMRLGAARVCSVDYDSDSVACAATLRERYFPGAAQWTVERGDALDTAYLASLGQWDVVYSWGVLHHTGDMWTALGNVVELVKPGGLLAISIYNDQRRRSQLWRAVKRTYNRAKLGRALVIVLFVPLFAILGAVADLSHGRNPIAQYREYRRRRGMSRVHDWLDWLGGYPFEVARPDAIFNFYKRRGFALRELITVGGSLGCNQFVFIRRETPAA